MTHDRQLRHNPPGITDRPGRPTSGDFGYQTGEQRITSETGGQKGRKPQRMDLIPPRALLALSEVYGFGGEKYDDHNYLKGYDWSLAYGALQRHLNQWQAGEDIDPESGLHHLLHAAWHALTLWTFQTEQIGTDDRFDTALAEIRGQVSNVAE